MDDTTIHGLAAAIAQAWDDEALERVCRAHLRIGADYPGYDWNQALAVVCADGATADRA